MFTVAVNHLKSKGSPCDDVGDPDTGDGQGNCNLTRTSGAAALAAWLAPTAFAADLEVVGAPGNLLEHGLGGVEVGTGDPDNPVYLDFDAGVTGFVADQVFLSLGEYVTVTGGMSWEKGSSEIVDVAMPRGFADFARMAFDIDVRDVAPDCLRHRLTLSYEASADGISANAVVEQLLQQVAVA